MTPLEPKGPNAEQIKFWNQAGIAYYFAHKDALKAERAPLTRRVIQRAAPTRERAPDVGCGLGDLTMELARQVGPSGFAVGIDLSSMMVEKARDSASSAGLRNIRFENSDAQTHAFPGRAFDVVVSQFGVMFFADPVAAFANLRSALRPGGRIAFVCWQSRERNQCLSIPLSTVARFVVEVAPPPPPGTPGQFGLADSDRVRGILESAGFADVAIEDLREKLPIGGGLGLDDTLKWFLDVEFRVTLAQVPKELRLQIEDAMRDALRPYLTRAGVLMESATWLVSAHNSW